MRFWGVCWGGFQFGYWKQERWYKNARDDIEALKEQSFKKETD
jgi:hypothetical protein